MDFGLIIGLAKWFILRQVGKFVEKIDWNKVADDFVDRISKMLPKEVYGDLEQMSTKEFMISFGKSYDARGLMAMRGTQHYSAAFEACFGDTEAAKLSSYQESYLAKIKPAAPKEEKKPDKVETKVADEKPKEKGGFLTGKGKKDKKTV